MINLPALEPPSFEPQIVIEQKIEEPKPVEYIVIDGDNLSKVAELHGTTVARLWAKNTELTNPDVLQVGQKLVIPLSDETLPDRPLYSIKPATEPLNASFEGLIGSIGYAKPYGNCVDEPGVNSPRNGTNPISWPVLSYTPTIGATALFNFNHTGVVVGIWSNGDLEIRHQNYSGGQHRFPASAFRGFR